MQQLIDDLVNGNLKRAKKQAQNYKKESIQKFLTQMGWSDERSEKAAHYLKTGEGWQAYCDCEIKERENC